MNIFRKLVDLVRKTALGVERVNWIVLRTGMKSLPGVNLKVHE